MRQGIRPGCGLACKIDRINILQATFAAMAHAVSRLKLNPGLLLIDGNQAIPPHILEEALARSKKTLPRQKTVVHGDSLEPAISAASILAKTFRDRIMIALDRHFAVMDLPDTRAMAPGIIWPVCANLAPPPCTERLFAVFYRIMARFRALFGNKAMRNKAADSTALHLELGRKGENAAENYLAACGYKILARNWRHSHLELDLVCRDKEYLVFVEVKYRSGQEMGHALEAVDTRKQRKMMPGGGLL